MKLNVKDKICKFIDLSQSARYYSLVNGKLTEYNDLLVPIGRDRIIVLINNVQDLTFEEFELWQKLH